MSYIIKKSKSLIRIGGLCMKNRKLKSLLGIFLALGMALSVGTALSVAKANKPAEIVLAEGDEEQETPTSNEENPANSEAESGNAEAEGNGAASQESASADEEEEKPAELSISPKDIVKIFLKAFRDAVKDLLRHIKHWIGR